MSSRVLIGPFLTRSEAARAAGVSRVEIEHRPDLLRLGGTLAEEVYFSWQFGSRGADPIIGRLVRALRAWADDATIADWMFRPQAALGASTPFRWLAASGDVETAILAFKRSTGR